MAVSDAADKCGWPQIYRHKRKQAKSGDRKQQGGASSSVREAVVTDGRSVFSDVDA